MSAVMGILGGGLQAFGENHWYSWRLVYSVQAQFAPDSK